MILHPLADVVPVVGVEVVVVAVAAESAVDLSSRDVVVVDNDSTVDLLSLRESSKLVRLLVLDSSAASAGVFGSNLLLLLFGSFGITKSSSSIASPLLRCCLLH